MWPQAQLRDVTPIKQAVHAPVQGVVRQGLPMGPVRHWCDCRVVNNKAGVAAAAIATTILQVRVGRQVAPEVGQSQKIWQLAAAQRTNASGIQHRKSLGAQGGQRRSDSRLWWQRL